MDTIAAPIIQYGFAGLCAVLLAILVWLVKTFAQVVKDLHNQSVELTQTTTSVVKENTEAIREVKSVEDQQVAVLTQLKDKLLERPCLLPNKGG